MPPGGDDEGIRGEHEVMQPGEERLVLEGLLDERIGLLLEGQLDPDAELLRLALTGSLGPSLAACISPGPPPVTMSQPISARAAAMA